jgi:RNA polymerase sigma-54 factor
MQLPELREYLFEQAIPNPLIEIEDTPEISLPTPEEEDRLSELLDATDSDDDGFISSASDPIDYSGISVYDDWDASSEKISLENLAMPNNNFLDMLNEQLLRLPGLGKEQKKLCKYLIECLSENGYLEFDLSEIAAEMNVPLLKMEQALYVVQSLQPTGVGARTLEECLILQLAQSNDFNPYSIGLVKNGLSLLAKDDIDGLAKLLGCTKEQAQKAANAVRRLEPIPSRGYAAGGQTLYQIPEAILHQERSEIIIEMNHRFLPRMHINTKIGIRLKNECNAKDMAYLHRQISQAKQLIQCVENRQSTIERLIKVIVQRQSGYFLAGKPLALMTMSQLADDLGLSISTVSRALQGKSVNFRGKNYLLRQLFTSGIITASTGRILSESVKLQIQRFIRAEDPVHPLSDEKLKAALDAIRLPVSRRTIAKYREELGIPSSSQRKQDSM